MSLWAHHRKQFQYDTWANVEVHKALAALRVPDQKSCSLMAHIIGSEWLWLNRVLGQPARMAVWPELGTLEGTTELLNVFAAWKEQLKSDDESELLREVQYVNSKGQPWTSTLGDILTHVVVHSAYHRGQISLVMRQQGSVPVYTDFIHAVREGYLSP